MIEGAFHFSPGGRRVESVTLDPDLLKEVYRMSNFNVTLQAKVSKGIASEYRAFCTRCGDAVAISYEELLAQVRNNPTWVQLNNFCDVHSHGAKVVVTEGRKFRDVN